MSQFHGDYHDNQGWELLNQFPFPPFINLLHITWVIEAVFTCHIFKVDRYLHSLTVVTRTKRDSKDQVYCSKIRIFQIAKLMFRAFIITHLMLLTHWVGWSSSAYWFCSMNVPLVSTRQEQILLWNVKNWYYRYSSLNRFNPQFTGWYTHHN